MNEAMRAGILEATRLIRARGLVEATVTIQRTLRGIVAPGAVADSPGQTTDAPIEGIFRVIDPDSLPSPGSADVRQGRVHGPSTRFRAPWRPHRWGYSEPASRPAPALDRACDVGGRFLTGSYTNQAGARTYKLYIPSAYHGQTLPLVIMLHGCTQDPDDFAAGTRMNVLAEEHLCFVVYPAQAPAANGSKCWNWFNAADQHRDQGEPSIIAGITRRIIGTYPVDSRRVYVAGLSAGGAMAAIMGMTYTDLYAAVGVHSGLPYAVAHDLPSALTAMKEGPTPGRLRDIGVPGAERCSLVVPTIVFHGDRDTKVHPSNGDQVIAQWTTIHARDGARNNARVDPQVTVQRGQVPDGHAYTRAIYHDASGQAILEQWCVHGAGHAWSGGSASGSYTDPKGPDAAKEMIRFFYEHPRREVTERTHAESAAGPAGHAAPQQPS
ncbi:MAG: extracellular catalytic domain type 1 short-chain-length polyhydroxyalkanoate depolymerase [Gammaproteobacteria bacterium]